MEAFSPLLIGEVVVTFLVMIGIEPSRAFSPLLIGEVVVTQDTHDMQSNYQTFSPLLIGEVVVTFSHGFNYFAWCSFQSPLNRGSGCN